MPVFQSSTYETVEGADYHDLRYIRLNNTPNHDVLHAKLAALEGTQAALCTASGMAAISTTLLGVLRPGDHFLAQACLYGGTHDFVTQDLATLGIECTFVDGNDRETWKNALRPNTRAFYCEAITNPLLDVADLPEIASFARDHRLVSLIDATFVTPINYRPAEHGFDLILHSATKYLNGHSDIVAGVVAGRRELIEPVRHKLGHFGGSLDPHACFLLHRGLKTLGVRVRQQNESALQLARALSEKPEVAAVRYPGLSTHPQHARARELFTGYGGMLSFELAGGLDAARSLTKKLTLACDAPSLGGPETLITRPATTSHVGMDPEARAKLGITDSLVRISVGLEHPDDLIEDFDQAL